MKIYKSLFYTNQYLNGKFSSFYSDCLRLSPKYYALLLLGFLIVNFICELSYNDCLAQSQHTAEGLPVVNKLPQAKKFTATNNSPTVNDLLALGEPTSTVNENEDAQDIRLREPMVEGPTIPAQDALNKDYKEHVQELRAAKHSAPTRAITGAQNDKIQAILKIEKQRNFGSWQSFSAR